jgi:hypothetical protein
VGTGIGEMSKTDGAWVRWTGVGRDITGSNFMHIKITDGHSAW